MDKKGEVLAKSWVKSAATCVVWDGVIRAEEMRAQEIESSGNDQDEGDVWAGMQDVGDDDDDTSGLEDEGHERKSKKQKAR